jgi:hypothetical protein
MDPGAELLLFSVMFILSADCKNGRWWAHLKLHSHGPV